MTHTGSECPSPEPDRDMKRTSSSLDCALDWPLSRAEKKDVVLRISNRMIEDHQRQLICFSPDCRDDSSLGDTSDLSSIKPSTRSKISLNGWEPMSEPSGTPRQLEPEAAVICKPRRLSLESGVSETSSAKACSGEDVKQNLEMRHEEMARHQQKQFEAFQMQQQQQMQEFLARFQEQSVESKHEESRSDHGRRELNLHHSCPARAQQATPPRPALRRRSRGGSLAPRVRFMEQQSDSSSDEDCTASAVARGRNRRVSRGPDGRSYTIPNEIGTEPAPQPAGNYAKAAAGGVAGGALGLGAGIVGGAVAGLPAALFTFGLSIPIGAAFGGGLGCSAGAAVGGGLGYKVGASSSESNVQSKKAKEPEESEE